MEPPRTPATDRPDPGDEDAVARAIADLLPAIVRAVSERAEQKRSAPTPEERLTVAQQLTLMVVAGGPRSVSEVAAATGVAPSSATRMVQTLERLGFVDRDPDTDGDRRRRVVTITPEGDRVLHESRRLQRERLRRLIAPLPPPVRAELVAGFRALGLAIALEAAGGAADGAAGGNPPDGGRADPA